MAEASQAAQPVQPAVEVQPEPADEDATDEDGDRVPGAAPDWEQLWRSRTSPLPAPPDMQGNQDPHPGGEAGEDDATGAAQRWSAPAVEVPELVEQAGQVMPYVQAAGQAVARSEVLPRAQPLVSAVQAYDAEVGPWLDSVREATDRVLEAPLYDDITLGVLGSMALKGGTVSSATSAATMGAISLGLATTPPTVLAAFAGGAAAAMAGAGSALLGAASILVDGHRLDDVQPLPTDTSVEQARAREGWEIGGEWVGAAVAGIPATLVTFPLGGPAVSIPLGAVIGTGGAVAGHFGGRALGDWMWSDDPPAEPGH